MLQLWMQLTAWDFISFFITCFLHTLLFLLLLLFFFFRRNIRFVSLSFPSFFLKYFTFNNSDIISGKSTYFCLLTSAYLLFSVTILKLWVQNNYLTFNINFSLSCLVHHVLHESVYDHLHWQEYVMYMHYNALLVHKCDVCHRWHHHY